MDPSNADFRQKLYDALFLTAGNITKAIQIVNIYRRTLYLALNADEEFRKEFYDVRDKALDQCEDEAIRRAYNGIEKGIWYQGQRVGSEIVYSDYLLIRLLMAHRPKWRTMYHEVGGEGGKPIPLQIDHNISDRLLKDGSLNRLAHSLLESIADDASGDGECPESGKVDSHQTPH